MRSGFLEREEALERKFQHDNEVQFKVRARRNRLFGYWAAEQLHLQGTELESYTTRIVHHTIRNPTDSSLVERIFEDFQGNDVPFTKHQIAKQLLYFQSDAQEEIKSGIAV